MKKNSFTYDDLISCGNGELFGPGNAKLPLPPMLMFDRITEINDSGGEFKKGIIKAVGPGTKENPVTLKAGDTVLYGKYSGTELKLENNDYLIMRESDVLAIV